MSVVNPIIILLLGSWTSKLFIMEDCADVKDYYMDPSTHIRHNCVDFICDVSDPEKSRPDCQHYCPEYYLCLLEISGKVRQSTKVDTLDNTENPEVDSSYGLNLNIYLIMTLFSVVTLIAVATFVGIYICRHGYISRCLKSRQSRQESGNGIELQDLNEESGRLPVPESGAEECPSDVELTGQRANSPASSARVRKSLPLEREFLTVETAPSWAGPPSYLRSISFETEPELPTICSGKAVGMRTEEEAPSVVSAETQTEVRTDCSERTVGTQTGSSDPVDETLVKAASGGCETEELARNQPEELVGSAGESEEASAWSSAAYRIDLCSDDADVDDLFEFPLVRYVRPRPPSDGSRGHLPPHSGHQSGAGDPEPDGESTLNYPVQEEMPLVSGSDTSVQPD